MTRTSIQSASRLCVDLAAALVCCGLLAGPGLALDGDGPTPAHSFLRGDSNSSGAVDVSDALFTLEYLFQGKHVPLACPDAADSNDDGDIDVSDPILALLALFLGRSIAFPFPATTGDPTEDALGCTRPAPRLVPIYPGSTEDWNPEPFVSGFGTLERGIGQSVYAYFADESGTIPMPKVPVVGETTIPVFLVDWSDFDPRVHESNHDNPASVCPGYAPRSPEELGELLNGPNGVSEYFLAISGLELRVRFDVFPWIRSSESTYVRDKEPAYYYTDGERWFADRTALARDVLKSAVVDLGADLTRYDADGNGTLDGFAIVYEGGPGKLSGTNLSWTDSNSDPLYTPIFNNVAALVASEDPNFARFQAQPILYNRYVNMPEQYFPRGPDQPGELSAVGTWAHEIGHLLLGYRDYYMQSPSPGDYMLSANHGHPIPYHASALEKLLFGKWIGAAAITEPGDYSLRDHHLPVGGTYSVTDVYLYVVPIGGDPNHYIALENRYFLPRAQGGSYFNESSAGRSPESGLVIFEVNLRAPAGQYIDSASHIRRLLPSRVDPDLSYESGAFRPGDTLEYSVPGFSLTVGGIGDPGPDVTFTVEIVRQ